MRRRLAFFAIDREGEKMAAQPEAAPRRAAIGAPRTPRERPSNLIYAGDQKVPASIGFVSALQHIAVIAGGYLPIPVLIGHAAGLSPAAMLSFLSLSFIALGVGALLQCAAGRFFGSGYLITFVFSGAYLTASTEAIALGGLPLLFGMTLFGGLVELLLAQVLPRLRPFFPAEIAGLCVTLIGIILGSLGMRLMLGIGEASGPVRLANTFWGEGTLALMIGLQVWGKGLPRMLSVFIGMIVGVLAGFKLGLYDLRPVAALAGTEPFRLPSLPGLNISFSAALVVPFLIAAAACCLDAMGDITMSQKINDRAWIRPDMASIRKGVTAAGLGTMISALLGSIGGTTCSSSVALANSSGVASRFVGYWAGGLLIALSAFPAVVGFFAFLPGPVMGAALVFTACFVLLSGLQIITSRLLDVRRIFVIGLALVLSLSRDAFPQYYAALPHFMHPFVASDLVVALLTAVILNAVFRIGVRKRQSLSVVPDGGTHQIIRDFFDDNGSKWGARRDVIDRAAFGCAQAVEIIADYGHPSGPILLDASFDEFSLDVTLSFDGPVLELAVERPSAEEVIAGGEGVLHLGGYLIRGHADRVRTASRGDRSIVEFHFQH
jgi:xanthine permease XanP